jgi:hypothetical protein
MKISKLKKLKMPAKKGEEMEGMEMATEAHDEDAPELAAAEEEMGMSLDKDMEEGEPAEHKAKVMGSELEALSDDELLAELKKRGLMSKLAEEGEEEADEMPMA